jgi:phospholipase A2
MTEKSSSLIISAISTRSRVALAALFTVTVVGTIYYRSQYNNQDNKKLQQKDGEEEEEHTITKDELIASIDDNSLYNDFVASLPHTLTLDLSIDSFLSNLFSGNPSDYIPSIIPASFEELKEKMAALYPNFESQLETIKNMYNTFWEYLSLEDFKNIVKESLAEDDDPILHPEIKQDAYVREGQSLCEEEIRFAKARKLKMKAAFAFFIGVEEHEVEIEDIPNIGIASR